MKNLRLEKDKILEGNVTKDVRNIFRLKKEINENIMKTMRNIFRPKVWNRDIRDIRSLFKHKEDYYKPVRVDNFWSNNYTENESIDDKKKHYQLKNILIKLDHN